MKIERIERITKEMNQPKGLNFKRLEASAERFSWVRFLKRFTVAKLSKQNMKPILAISFFSREGKPGIASKLN